MSAWAAAYRALREGGTLPAALNAANEEAVQAFIDQQIGLGDIPRVIESVMNQHPTQQVTGLDVVLQSDSNARISAIAEIEKLSHRANLLAESPV